MEDGFTDSGSVSQWVRDVLFGEGASRRFILEGPLGEAVWISYAVDEPRSPVREGYFGGFRRSLLLSPVDPESADTLYTRLIIRLAAAKRCGVFVDRLSVDVTDYLRQFEVKRNASQVAVTMDFPEMVTLLLPLTTWWQKGRVGDGERQDRGRAGARACQGHDSVAAGPQVPGNQHT